MIDQIAKELFTNFQQQTENLRHIKEGSESQFKALLESAIQKLDLVSREEFETQQAVLLRTREKLETLEQKLDELNQTLAAQKPS